jgi:hypothetical protein
MMVLENTLVSTNRKSKSTKKLHTRKYSKLPWWLRNTTQHNRHVKTIKLSQTLRKILRSSEGASNDANYQSTMISSYPSNTIVSEGDNHYKTPHISNHSPIIHWLICKRYMMQRYFHSTNVVYVTQKHDDDEDPGRATRFDTDSVPIRINNCCSRSLSHDISDFLPDTIHDSRQRITIKELWQYEYTYPSVWHYTMAYFGWQWQWT